jgi:esterase/lipase superfamily enzyme
LLLAATLSACATDGAGLGDVLGSGETHADRARAKFATLAAVPPVAATVPAATPADTHAVVKVYYATDRRRADAGPGKIGFSTERGALGYGTAFVSIPRDHRMGQLERPSVWRFWASEDPDRYVVLLKVGELSRQGLLGAMQQDLKGTRRREALVFVHGYNVSFEDAALRTAQLKYDLQLDGPALFFSWPSLGAVSGYRADRDAVARSVPAIQSVLADIGKSSGASTVYLIAHSMGNVGLLSALATLPNSERARLMPRLREIVLAAPDIDRDLFVKQILPKVASARSRVTLYASANDRALMASGEIEGAARLGDIRSSGIVIARGLDSIDASGVDTSLVGHSYYADNRSIISDLFYLIQQGVGPERRFGLEPVRVEPGVYWRFRR